MATTPSGLVKDTKAAVPDELIVKRCKAWHEYYTTLKTCGFNAAEALAILRTIIQAQMVK
jgi:hypothetical protein